MAELGRPAIVGDEVQVSRAHLRVEQVERLKILSLVLTISPDEDEAKRGQQVLAARNATPAPNAPEPESPNEAHDSNQVALG